MEEEKKPKRPRIGIGLSDIRTDGASAPEARYEKVNYPGENADKSPTAGRTYSNPNAQYRRPQQYGNTGYNRSQSSGYDRPRYNSPYASATPGADAKPQTEGDEQRSSFDHPQNYRQMTPREGNAEQQGGYQQRYNPNYQQRYNPNRQQGGYGQQRQQGGYGQQRPYNQNRQQGGYGQQRPYNPNRQQGGYNQQRQQGGYNQNRQQGGYNQNRQQRPYNPNYQQGGNNYNQNRGYQNQNRQGGFNRNQGGYQQKNQKPGMRFTPRPKQIDYVLEDIDPNESIRLNKYMANAGLCSRREADEYIQKGMVKVNGETVTELGTKISRSDVVEYDEKVVVPEKKCYVLLNKPKDCVTTTDDPNGRTTVLDLVKTACKERIYPVGRLDRNTTGVLLLTNDGDLASKLTHPKFVKKKIYHVWTDKDIAEEDMQRIADGIELDDGEIHADAISYVNDTDRNQAGIEIHSGRNRIVRRIFEHLGYRVTKLDRVYFAGLTKKNLPRGRWRYLTQEEVNFLRRGSFE